MTAPCHLAWQHDALRAGVMLCQCQPQFWLGHQLKFITHTFQQLHSPFAIIPSLRGGNCQQRLKTVGLRLPVALHIHRQYAQWATVCGQKIQRGVISHRCGRPTQASAKLVKPSRTRRACIHSIFSLVKGRSRWVAAANSANALSTPSSLRAEPCSLGISFCSTWASSASL